MITRRAFLKYTGATVLALYAWDGTRPVAVAHAVPGGSLDPTGIPQFVEPLVVPATMPSARREGAGPQGPIDVYDIAVRQFEQRMLPTPLPLTTVWGYGPTGQGRDTFHAPSMTIEATHGTPIRVTWRNELVDDRRGYLSHLLPVDPTLHWANPERRPGHGGAVTDTKPDFSGLGYAPPGEFSDSGTQYTLYSGPVPLVTHVHGAVGVGDESDGYPEAWYLPVASNLDTAYAPHGAWYEFFRAKAKAKLGVDWAPGTQTSHYPNTSSECTLWYHDHTLGLTRLNVYAGPAGFFLVRGGPEGEDGVLDARTRKPAVLPGPEKGQGQGNAPVRDIPIAIQDRSFNADGSLFYPDARAIFDEYAGPFVPETPVPPAWNPEFFGNTLIANGRTWPFLEVEQRRYRLRLLNGCNSRFLILDFSGIPGVKVALVGNDGGFLPEVHDVMADRGRLLLGTAERADVIVDFTDVPLGNHVLRNLGPDEPYGGGEPGADFEKAVGATTGRVLQFRVGRRVGADTSTPIEFLQLPVRPALPAEVRTRRVALLEHEHGAGEEAAPTAALLGTLEDWDGRIEAVARTWMDEVTENPGQGETEVWEIFNFTPDAHTVHVHEVLFEVVGRRGFTLADGRLELTGEAPVHAGERGRKDTVIAYPGQVTRIRARFSTAGQYVWHCHVLEHEDNEMMRPYRIGPRQPGQPG